MGGSVKFKSEAFRDLVSGGVVLVFCITIYASIPYQVVIEETGNLTAASVPSILLIIIGTLAAFLSLRGLISLHASPSDEDSTNKTTELKGMVYVLYAAFSLIVYVIAISWIGYLLSTMMILFFLSILFGQRVYWRILIFMIVVPPILFFFFRYTMFVLLPQGRLFE